MVEADAVVERVEAGALWVRTETKTACGSCSVDGCGVSGLGEFFGNRHNRLRLESDDALQPGDAVVIGIEDGVLTRAALLAYLWPLAAMILTALLAAAADLGEGAGALFSVFGLLAGLGLSRHLTGGGRDYQPRLLRRAGAMPVHFYLPEEKKS